LIACTAGGFSQVMIFSVPETADALDAAGLVVLGEELQAAPSTVTAMASVAARQRRKDRGLLQRKDMR
jgi:hypothetical protein